VEELLSRLIEEDYLNEERFAVAYARGKFGMKGWGKVKIIQGLKEKRVSDYCITRAMREIDENQYATTLHKLSSRKWNSLNSEKNIFIKMRKTQNYLLQKGFEPGLVSESMHQLRSGQSEDD
jgi:regulatory protein